MACVSVYVKNDVNYACICMRNVLQCYLIVLKANNIYTWVELPTTTV